MGRILVASRQSRSQGQAGIDPAQSAGVALSGEAPLASTERRGATTDSLPKAPRSLENWSSLNALTRLAELGLDLVHRPTGQPDWL